MNTKYYCEKNIEIVEIENEWIIMDPEDFTVTKVNAIGADILAALMEEKSIDEIIRRIQSHYGIEENVVRSDVLTFMEELREVGLVTYERA